MLIYEKYKICETYEECMKIFCKGCFLYDIEGIHCDKEGCPEKLIPVFIKAGAKKVEEKC